MKKLLISIAALLLCSFAHSQEADNLGSYAEVKLISRLDLKPSYNFGDSEMGFDFGNSLFCTTFEGSASEHFSWFVCNQWVSSDGIKWPYQNLGRSDDVNWLNYCYADISFGNWTLTLGKDFISTGGFELDNWDWDVYSAVSSPYFDGLSCYQWGAKLSYTILSETNTFSLQMVSSPYGEHPFSSKLWSYSAQWRAEYDYFATIWSYSAIEREKNSFENVITLGTQFYLGNWTLTFDYFNNVGFYTESDWSIAPGNTYQARVQYAPSEKFDIALHSAYMSADKNGLLPANYRVAAVAQFYPLADSEALRLHATAGYDSLSDSMSLMIGAKYEFSFKLW